MRFFSCVVFVITSPSGDRSNTKIYFVDNIGLLRLLPQLLGNFADQGVWKPMWFSVGKLGAGGCSFESDWLSEWSRFFWLKQARNKE